MHYFLSVRILGLCSRIALRSHDLSEDYPCVVFHLDRVIDVNSAALENHVPIGIPLKEAKVILQDRAAYYEFIPEKFKEAQEALFLPALKYSDRVQVGVGAEGFVDFSSHPQPIEVVASYLNEIHSTVQLPIVAGLASSLWLARLSAQVCDPVMLSVGLPSFEPVDCPSEWLAPRSVEVLTPVLTQDRIKLHQLGFDRVIQVQSALLMRLEQQFPKRGLLIHQAAMGKVADTIKPNFPGKMVTQEICLSGSQNSLEIDRAFGELARELAEHLSLSDQQAGSMNLTIQFEDGERRNHIRKLAKPIYSASQLRIAFQQSLLIIKADQPIDVIRAQLLDLTQSVRRQTRLGLESQDREAQAHIATTLNRLEASLGSGAVQVASKISTPYNVQVLREWKRATGWR